ncbi:MAG TPA: hypothetical protein VHE12_07390 [bacterium]|nr:hypothetical protein [bacterium]
MKTANLQRMWNGRTCALWPRAKRTIRKKVMDPIRIKSGIVPIDSLDLYIERFLGTKAMGRVPEWVGKAFGLERGALVQVNAIEACPKCGSSLGTEILIIREQGIERYRIPKPPHKLVLRDLRKACGIETGHKPVPKC